MQEILLTLQALLFPPVSPLRRAWTFTLMCLIAGAIGVDSHLTPTAGAQTAHPDVDLQAADGLLKKQAGAEENRKHTETTPTAGIAAQGNHVLRFGFLACQLVIACSVPLLPHDQPHSIDAVDAAQPFVAQ